MSWISTLPCTLQAVSFFTSVRRVSSVRLTIPSSFNLHNYKNYNFFNCDWFKETSYFPLIHLECLGLLCQYCNANFPFFCNLAILLFSETSSDFIITRMITGRIGLYSILLTLLIVTQFRERRISGTKTEYS